MGHSFLESLSRQMFSQTFNPELWAKYPYWKTEEIAAFSLGRHPQDPILVHEDAASQPKIVTEFLDRLEVVTRAIKVGQIKVDCPPIEAMNWLEKNKFSFPRELKAEVISFHDEPDKDKVHAEVIRHLVFLLERERAKVAELQTQLSDQLEEITPLKLKSYELMIAGMAVVGYAFDPSQKQSKANKDIADDIARLGHELTPETIRNHLKTVCRKHEIHSRPE